MGKFMHAIDQNLKRLLIVLMALLVVDVAWQVTSRYLLGNPSSYTEEIARFLLLWISLLGAAHAYANRMHLGIDLFIEKLNAKNKRLAKIFSHLLVAAFVFFGMTLGGFKLVKFAFELNQVSAALGVKMGYIYLVIPLSGALITLYTIVFLIETISEKNNKSKVLPYK